MADENYTPFESFTEADADEWRVSWDRDEEPTERTTTLVTIAWFACNYDDEATVEAV